MTASAISFGPDRQVRAASPHPAAWTDLRARYAFNPARTALADGFEGWVRELGAVVDIGCIWIGGSFCSPLARPRDVDAVLFYRTRDFMPDPLDRTRFLAAHRRLFARDDVLARWRVDAATIPLSLPPLELVRQAARWSLVLSNGPRGGRRGFHALEGIGLPQ